MDGAPNTSSPSSQPNADLSLPAQTTDNLNSVAGNASNASIIITPFRTLMVLCGPAGCGKSTFGQRIIAQGWQQGLRSTAIVSSDHCRALISDDENNQHINRDAFDLFYYIIHKRLLQGRFTIADSTALRTDTRRRLLAMAQRYNYTTILIIFNITPELCIQRDQQRGRTVGEHVIAHHSQQLQHILQAAPDEGWNQLFIMSEQNENQPVQIALK